MIAKGRDASELFPAVVKNVVSKNIEVKKLVYVYLVRYAEQQQDLALLSISTFQRALKVIYFEWKYYKIKFKIIEGCSARTGISTILKFIILFTPKIIIKFVWL